MLHQNPWDRQIIRLRSETSYNASMERHVDGRIDSGEASNASCAVVVHSLYISEPHEL